MSDNTGIWIIITGASSVAAITFYVKLQNLKNKISELNVKLKQSDMELQRLEIENTSAKLNPHLLKNTLQTIHFFSWQTNQAIEKLSEILNYILYDSKNKYVPLKKEIDLLNTYIELHRLKLSPQTTVVKNIEAPITNINAKIAPLTTINFIENAFVHGDFTMPVSLLEINLKISNQELVYTVKNTFSKKEGIPGIGNENFKKRMDLLHKNQYSLEIAEEENMYISSLKLKLNEN